MDDDEKSPYDFDVEAETTSRPDGLAEVTITISPGRRVALRELNVAEFGAVMDAGGSEWDVAVRGIKRSLVRDRGEELTPDMLAGALFTQRFRVPEIMAMRLLWTQMHMIGEAQIQSIQAIRVG